MNTPRKRRVVHGKAVQEAGQRLVKVEAEPAEPTPHRAAERRSEGGLGMPAAEPPESARSQGLGNAADVDGLPALTNEQIEDRLRRLAGVSLDVLERLTRTVAAGGKAPRNAQSIAMTAQWAIVEARKVAKSVESAETAKRAAATLDKARKLFGEPAALTAELQQRKLADQIAEQAKLDS